MLSWKTIKDTLGHSKSTRRPPLPAKSNLAAQNLATERSTEELIWISAKEVMLSTGTCDIYVSLTASVKTAHLSGYVKIGENSRVLQFFSAVGEGDHYYVFNVFGKKCLNQHPSPFPPSLWPRLRQENRHFQKGARKITAPNSVKMHVW